MSTIFQYIKDGNLEAAKTELLANPNAKEVLDERGFSPLVLSTYLRKLDITKCLVEAGAEVNKKDKVGNTALLGVAFKGYVDIAEFLLSRGADANSANQMGATPLIYAAMFGHADLIGVLLANGADRDLKDGQGNTALDIARQKGNQSCVERLNGES